jgi:hypothetical protein
VRVIILERGLAYLIIFYYYLLLLPLPPFVEPKNQ